jgi:glyoxalase/bleomycin resistance protein/dioxygenase superfamily protein
MTQHEFPGEGVALSHLLVVSNLEQSRQFYCDVLGATFYREYGGTSCVLQFQGSWLLLVTGGGPTRDKPTILFAPPQDPNTVSHEMTIRVPDCQKRNFMEDQILSLIQKSELTRISDDITSIYTNKVSPSFAPI